MEKNKTKKEKSFLIRNIDENLFNYLKNLSIKEKRSINNQILFILESNKIINDLEEQMINGKL